MKPKPFGQLNFLQILAYNLGMSAEVITLSTVGLLAMPIYSMALGVNPAMVGIIFFIPRFLDAIIDPLMGYLSDNTRTKWGRRRPYLAIGGILTGLSYMLMWCPPLFLTKTGLFAYFLIWSIIFYISLTVYIVPYYALGNEITFDSRIRAKVMAWRNLIWGGVTLLAPWTYSLCFSPYFGKNELEGVRVVGLIFGSFVALCALIPAIFSRENMEIQKQPRINFIPALKESFSNKAFLILSIVRMCANFGTGLVGPMIIYVITYHVYKGDKSATASLWGFVGMSWGIGAIVSAPIVDYLVKSLGTKITLYISLIAVCVGQVLSLPLITPANPYLSTIPFLFGAPGIMGLFAVTSIWLADVCDYDEYLYGKRREGMFSAVISLIFKIGTAIATGLSGLLIAIAGISAEPGVTQTEHAVSMLRYLYTFVPIGFVIVSAALGWFYPLNEQTMKEIKAELDKRSSKK
ncbi:MAG: hypothetical protein A2Y12_15440 [Planctomycetes bacterium GWF2_42_9]|nr:MAG: hypothetical protein A2Y12_15440 [Planctomycetes bacterium GWF2_42_9]